MIQVNRIYLIFNRLVTKKFLVDTSEIPIYNITLMVHIVQRFQYSTFRIFEFQSFTCTLQVAFRMF